MEWWIWLAIVVAVAVMSVLATLLVQARRRSGGVIASYSASYDRTRPGGGS